MAQSGIMALASRRRLESGHEMGRVVKSLRALCMHRTPLVTFVINLAVIRIRPDAFACVLSHGWGSCKEVFYLVHSFMVFNILVSQQSIL